MKDIDENETAKAELKNLIKPSGKVYVSLVHVSRSLLQRAFRVYVITQDEKGNPYLENITQEVSLVTGFAIDEQHEGVRVRGSGQDMAAYLVRNISRNVFGSDNAIIYSLL
jgi:hypothetical protein